MRRRLITLAALAVKGLRIARTYRVALVLELGFGLLNLAVFYFVARLLDSQEIGFADVGGFFDYAAVGIAIAVVVEAAVTGIAIQLREEQLTGTLEELSLQPLRSSDLALGLGALPLATASVRVVVYLAAGWLLLGLELGNANWVGAFLVLLSIAAALLSIGALAAAVTLLVKRSEVVLGIAAFGIAIIGGAYFPIATFPPPLDSLAQALPIHLVFDAARDALLVGHGWEGDVLAIGAFAIIALPLSLIVFGAALKRAKRRATVSEY